jgi:hypothetical protein
MKRCFKAMRFLAIYIVALASFTTLVYASTRSSDIHYSETSESRGFVCEGCGADSWVVGYDQNDKPFNAVCFICAAEYLVEEDGTFAERIDK